MEKSHSKQIEKVVSDLESLIQKAKVVGFDKVPESTNELDTKICVIFEQSGKILTAKMVQKIIGEKETKWYSDKLWYLAKKGILQKCETRGYYKWKGNPSS